MMGLSENKAKKAMTKLQSYKSETLINYIFEHPDEFDDVPEDKKKDEEVKPEPKEEVKTDI
jgi:uncharacterized UBP type Zn finger protein